MLPMSVTCETFQLSRCWLKVLAWKNIRSMLITFETFQPEMLPLKS